MPSSWGPGEAPVHARGVGGHGAPPPVDAEARRLIVEALDETVVVEAAAGTGKTTELIRRVLRILSTGRAAVADIVAVTFTEKAAGELKLRLREQLERARLEADDPVVAQRLHAGVQNLEQAHVNTIHGFCADLLRERPVEARVDPLFRVLTEGQARRLFEEAFAVWFEGVVEHPPEGVRRSLRRPSRGFRQGEADEDGPIERLRRSGFELTQWRDFPTAWTREPFDRDAEMAAVVELVHRLAQVSASPSYPGDNLFVDTAPVRALSRDLRQASPSEDQDLDALEARLVELRRNRDFARCRKGSGPTYGAGVTRAQVLAARDALLTALTAFHEQADADLAAALHQELLECVRGYETLKARAGALDFLDLLLRARDVIRSNAAVRAHFQQRFTHVFVDEFQDTDPLQAEILLLLCAGDPGEDDWRHVRVTPGKLFIVGDPKQSIYRFRRADVEVYHDVCSQLVRGGARAITLETSFRSVPTIQRVVNAAFEPVMAMPGRPYVPLARARDDSGTQPSVVVLPVPEPYAQRYVAAKAIEVSLPDAVGAWVDWLLNESGWTVTERRDPRLRIPVRARHVCVLFRRFVSYGEDVTRPYVEALEARGITHLLVGGRAFHDREEIETLRAALMAIEWPDDQLNVFATLRGALFAVGDEELLEYRHRYGAFHPFHGTSTLPPHLEPISDALATLRDLHIHRNRRPVADTIGRLLDSTRAHVSFALRPGGEQALANVLHVAELARRYELEGGLSFRGFVDTLQEASGENVAAEAAILEEGCDGVRLMTAHKAKGLEFPVVVLADLTAPLAPVAAGRYIDTAQTLCALRICGWSPIDLVRHQQLELEREVHEGERVAYVAATRARDLLVIPAVGDRPYENSWINPLSPAIYPPESIRRVQTAALGCPVFKSKDSVLRRPDNDPATRATVCPGEHRFASPVGDYSLTWWSPHPDALQLGAHAPFGLRRDDLIVKDVPFSVLQAQHEGYRAWHAGRAAAVAQSSVPSLDVITATEAAAMLDLSALSAVEVSVDECVRSARQLAGARFGSLVHALLADVPFDDETALSQLSLAHGRVLGASADEVTEATAVVARALAHPLMRRAAEAARHGQCYREVPVTYTLGAGRLIEGTADLAFEDNEGYIVVDFKTDRELDGALDRYCRQLQIYVAAVAAATGRAARGVLLRM
jgi:ATP-dependent exoDNAse (exonuclease V) beta subunit